MFCNKCGAENPDDATFCEKCGASLTSPAPAKPKAAGKAATATAGGNISAMIKGFPIVEILLYGAIAALIIAVLVGILDAAGAGKYVKSAAKAGLFFDALLRGILVAGILAGFSALVSSSKK